MPCLNHGSGQAGYLADPLLPTGWIVVLRLASEDAGELCGDDTFDSDSILIRLSDKR